MEHKTYRILAKNEYRCNDTRETGLNNNDLIIGPSGAGKTRSYVKTNLLQCNESIVVADTKGNLRKEVGPVMEQHGYKVITVDFTDLDHSWGYNPMDYISYDPMTGTYSSQDIKTISNCLNPHVRSDDPFWDNAAKQYMECAICYILDCLPKREHHLESLCRLVGEMAPRDGEGGGNFARLMDEYEALMPESMGVRQYRLFRSNVHAEKMYSSILGIIAEKLNVFTLDGVVKMLKNPKRIRFEELSKRKTAVFLNMSDTDRSMDKLANLFYTQCFQALCKQADRSENSRLEIPVRLILDDFATNVVIPDFDRLISVIRSREIYTSVILQSLSQLEAAYDHQKAMTIINNCDNCLYLGGQDVETAEYIAKKVNKTANTILNLPLNEAYLFTRGSIPKKVEKFELKEHELYPELPEAQMG